MGHTSTSTCLLSGLFGQESSVSFFLFGQLQIVQTRVSHAEIVIIIVIVIVTITFSCSSFLLVPLRCFKPPRSSRPDLHPSELRQRLHSTHAERRPRCHEPPGLGGVRAGLHLRRLAGGLRALGTRWRDPGVRLRGGRLSDGCGRETGFRARMSGGGVGVLFSGGLIWFMLGSS